MPMYNFSNGQGQPDPNLQAGMQQYAAQGQSGINPGAVQVAQADPISAQSKQGLAQGLGSLLKNYNNQPGQPDPTQMPGGVAQDAMAGGASMQPNSPSGENMGGVGPTVNNLMLAQGLMGQPSAAQMLQSPNNMVNPANNFNNMNYMGGS